MRPHEAQARMFALEHHEQEFDGIDYIAWLLGFDDYTDASEAVIGESQRAFLLAEGHYQRVTRRAAVLNPQMIAQIGFIQGATFAAAALGRKPWPAKVGE